jgi:hypothetical protein
MLVSAAILAILCCFVCGWGVIMARNPKHWRLWWMNFFGYLDLNSTREQRRAQESHLKWFSCLLSLMCLAVAVSCSYWVIMETQEIRRAKTPIEKDQEMTMRQLEKMRHKFRKLGS